MLKLNLVNCLKSEHLKCQVLKALIANFCIFIVSLITKFVAFCCLFAHFLKVCFFNKWLLWLELDAFPFCLHRLNRDFFFFFLQPCFGQVKCFAPLTDGRSQTFFRMRQHICQSLTCSISNKPLNLYQLGRGETNEAFKKGCLQLVLQTFVHSVCNKQTCPAG